MAVHVSRRFPGVEPAPCPSQPGEPRRIDVVDVLSRSSHGAIRVKASPDLILHSLPAVEFSPSKGGTWRASAARFLYQIACQKRRRHVPRLGDVPAPAVPTKC